MRRDTNMSNWRNKQVNLAAQEAGIPVIFVGPEMPPVSSNSTMTTLARDVTKKIPSPRELVVIPYYEYTVGLWGMHPLECTHYCSSPVIYLPVWKSLRVAMDRQFSSFP
jgi:hypothetical protein